MKRIVVTFAGKEEVKAAEVIAGAVGRFLSERGFEGATVEVKRYRQEEYGTQKAAPACRSGRRDGDGTHRPVRY